MPILIGSVAHTAAPLKATPAIVTIPIKPQSQRPCTDARAVILSFNPSPWPSCPHSWRRRAAVRRRDEPSQRGATMNMRAGEYLAMLRWPPRARPTFGVLLSPPGVNAAPESLRLRRRPAAGRPKACFSDQTDRRSGVVTRQLTECTKAGSVSPHQRSIRVSGWRRKAQRPGSLDEPTAPGVLINQPQPATTGTRVRRPDGHLIKRCNLRAHPQTSWCRKRYRTQPLTTERSNHARRYRYRIARTAD
jgi:hypothetical protein